LEIESRCGKNGDPHTIVHNVRPMLSRRTYRRLMRIPTYQTMPSRVILPIAVQCSRRHASGLNPLPIDAEATENTSPNTKTHQRVWDGVLTTIATLACLGVAGYAYHKYYKWLVLKKIEKAFMPGDPALNLSPRVISQASTEAQGSHWVTRLYALIMLIKDGNRFSLIGLLLGRRLDIISC
jgi:hypothetical protein